MKRTYPLESLNKRKLLMLAISLVFFFFFMLLDGPYLETDSPAYLTFHPSRMEVPVYPLFLALMRLVPFPGGGAFEGHPGVWQALVFQNLIWGAATFFFGNFIMGFYIRRDAQKGTDTSSMLLAWQNKQEANRDLNRAFWMGMAGIGFQFVVALLNRFAAPRRCMYSNQIMSEALTMPLFILFLVFLYRLIRYRRKSDSRLCALCAFFLIGLRGHMKVVLVIWLASAALYFLVLKKSRSPGLFLASVFRIVVVLIVCSFFIAVTNQIRYGRWTTASNPEAVLCNLLYIADDDSSELFREGEEQEKEWFEQIRKMQKERGALLLARPSDADFFEKETHYALNYDVIGYEIVHPVIYETADTERIFAGEDRILFLRDAERRLSDVLKRQDMTEYVRMAAVNFVAAFAYSNARFTKLLLPLSAFMYALYILLLFLVIRKRSALRRIICHDEENAGKPQTTLIQEHQESPGQRVEKAERIDSVISFSALLLIATLVNASLVALTIFPQGRYMIYCMGMFYTCMMLMMSVLD